jgi:hypothetical protein
MGASKGGGTGIFIVEKVELLMTWISALDRVVPPLKLERLGLAED